MKWGLASVRLTVLAAVVTVGVLTLFACGTSGPSLRANLPNGARDVPLATNLQIIAEGALIQQAILQRIDVASEAIELPRSSNGADLSAKLEPDAQYRLVVSAEP